MPVINKVVLLAVLAPSLLCAANKGIERGLRFDSPGVLDLSVRPLKLSGSHGVATAALDTAAAEAIVAAPALDEGNPAALPFLESAANCGEAKDCAKTAERTQVEANSRRVARDGKQLVVTSIDGPAVTFIDWVQPEKKNAEGDFETHYYLGRLAGNNYHRVEVQFGHDAPGSFLINPKNGKTAFVHNGGDITALSQSGWHIVDLASSDAQHPLRIANLLDDGPRVELQCAVAGHDRKIDVRLKGWHDPFTLDLELDLPEPVAVRLARKPAGTWTQAASDPARVAASGFRCE